MAAKRLAEDDIDKTQDDIKTFVFLDFETTGFLHEKARVTEMCLLAVNKRDLLKTEYPRVINKITLCFNPGKPLTPSASVVSGLNLGMLKRQAHLTSQSVTLINGFLSHLREPICLLAHYGNKFDFPLLLAEITKQSGALKASVFFADTLEAFRALDSPSRRNPTIEIRSQPKKMKAESSTICEKKLKKSKSVPVDPRAGTKGKQPIPKAGTSSKPEMLKFPSSPSSSVSYTNKSFKLEDIYRRIFGEDPPKNHTAEGDCINLLKIAQHSPGFIEWVNENASTLSTISRSYIIRE